MNENNAGAETLVSEEAPKTSTAIVIANAALLIAFGDAVSKVEFNGVEATTEEDKVTFTRQYIRNKVLKQFGVSEVQKNMVTGGKLYFNDGNRNALKLPKVKEDKNSMFTESLEEYYDRVKPEIAKWLARSIQTSHITMEQVGLLAS